MPRLCLSEFPSVSKHSRLLGRLKFRFVAMRVVKRVRVFRDLGSFHGLFSRLSMNSTLEIRFHRKTKTGHVACLTTRDAVDPIK